MERIKLETKAELTLEELLSSTFVEFEMNRALVISALDNIESLSNDLLENIIENNQIRFEYMDREDLEAIDFSYHEYLKDTLMDLGDIEEIEKQIKEALDEFKASAKIHNKKEKKMKKHNYKERETYIGYSDIASLITVGIGEKGLETHIIRYGGDSTYRAYILHNEEEVPSHYELEAQFKYWAKIYDDDSLVIKAQGDLIEIYRAGEYGTLIRVKGSNAKVERIDC